MNPTRNQRATPTVSILIPTWRDTDSLAALFSDLDAQTFSDFEVIVIDASSDGRSRFVPAGHLDGRLTIIRSELPSTPHQLNLGLTAAAGTYIARIDAHTRVPTDYLDTVISHLRTGYSGVGVRKRAVGATRVGAAFARSLNSPRRTGGARYHSSTDTKEVDHVPYAAYPAELVRALGGWDERFLSNQDVELDIRVRRAGGRLVLDGRIHTDWLIKNDLLSIARQYLRYGSGRARTARLHPSSLGLRHGVLLGATFAGALALLGAGLGRPRLMLPCVFVVTVNASLASLDLAAEGQRPLGSSTIGESAIQGAVTTVAQLSWGVGFLRTFVDPHALDPARADLSSRRRMQRSHRYA